MTSRRDLRTNTRSNDASEGQGEANEIMGRDRRDEGRKGNDPRAELPLRLSELARYTRELAVLLAIIIAPFPATEIPEEGNGVAGSSRPINPGITILSVVNSTSTRAYELINNARMEWKRIKLKEGRKRRTRVLKHDWMFSR